MNSLAHIFFNFFILHFFVDVTQFIWPIIIFSIILDIDHIPGLIKYLFFMKKHDKTDTKLHHFTDLFRTAVQEPIGIFIIVAILSTLSWFGVDSILLSISAACLILHWLLDFLTVHTKPFNPVSQKAHSLFIHTFKQKKWAEISLTIFFALLNWIFVF